MFKIPELIAVKFTQTPDFSGVYYLKAIVSVCNRLKIPLSLIKAYKGEKECIVNGVHEPIITKNIFDKVQDGLTHGSFKHQLMFAGIAERIENAYNFYFKHLFNENISIFTTVKLLNIIMSVIIIALSGIPCADGAPSSNKSPQTVQADSNSHTGHDTDSCSPFCVCNCCQAIGFFEVKQAVSDAIFVSALIEKQLPRYTSTLFSNFQNTIWQPPKIS